MGTGKYPGAEVRQEWKKTVKDYSVGASLINFQLSFQCITENGKHSGEA